MRDLSLSTVTSKIDYYGVTFDHNVPADDEFPRSCKFRLLEIEADDEEHSIKVLPFQIDPACYIGKKILALSWCCQCSKSSTDYKSFNGLAARRERDLATRHGP